MLAPELAEIVGKLNVPQKFFSFKMPGFNAEVFPNTF
jgi:hypothetical protein